MANGMGNNNGNWMDNAVSKPGSFSKSAASAGQSTMQYAKAKREAPGLLGKRARLALTFAKFRPKSSSAT